MGICDIIYVLIYLLRQSMTPKRGPCRTTVCPKQTPGYGRERISGKENRCLLCATIGRSFAITCHNPSCRLKRRAQDPSVALTLAAIGCYECTEWVGRRVRTRNGTRTSRNSLKSRWNQQGRSITKNCMSGQHGQNFLTGVSQSSSCC